MNALLSPASRRLWLIRFRRNGPRLALYALLAVAVAGSVKMAIKASKPSVLGTYTRTAFLRWRPQLEELERGTDIYRAFNYPNPPVMALTLLPFTKLPPLPAALLWYYLKVGMAGAGVLWAVRLATPRGEPVAPLVPAAVALLALHPILGDLSHGNINIYIAFLVLGGLELFRRGRDLGAGLLFALAAACKVTPALFLPYLLWKRAYRAAAAMTVGLGLFLFAVPGAALGWERNVTLLTGWYEGMVRPFVVEGKVTSELANQSIPGVAARLLSSAPSEIAYDEDDKPVPAGYHTLLDLGPAGSRRAVQGAQAAFALLGLLLLRTPVVGPGRERQGVRFAAEVGFVALGMLLFSERTWKHHSIPLVIPYAAIVMALQQPAGAGPRRFLIGALALTLPLGYGPSLVGGDFQDECLAYGSQTAVFLLLTASVAAILWAKQASPPSPVRRGAGGDRWGTGFGRPPGPNVSVNTTTVRSLTASPPSASSPVP